MRSTSSAPAPPSSRRGKRERLASALDAIGLLDRALWVKSKLGLPVLTVLTYHRIAEDADVGELDTDVIDVRPGAFAQQLELLREHCHPITTADLVAFRKGKALPSNPVLIAFDDGYMDCHDVALPLLRRAGMPATFFVPTAYPDAGRLFWWDKVSILVRRSKVDRVELSYPAAATIELADPQAATLAVSHLIKNNPGIDPERLIEELERAAGVSISAEEEKRIAARTIMGMNEVRALQDAGMDVQSHSHSHRVLDTMTPEAARDDLLQSRQILSEVLGRPVEAVAYPVGYTLRGKYRRIAEDSGFAIGFTNSSGLCRLDELDPYSVPRIAMGTEHVGSSAKLIFLLGAQPHRLHDPKLRLFTGESSQPLQRRLVTQLPRLAALAPEWNDLEQRCAARSPTVTADWMLTWWRMFGDAGGRQLAVLEVRDGDRLVGLAPLQTRRHWYPPAVPYRRVELLASGEDEADEVLSEYIGVLAERGYEGRVAEELAAALTGSDVPPWDELVMPLMDGTARMPQLVADALRDRGVRVQQAQQSEAPYIELPGSWDGYLAALSSERRYFVKRSVRDFERWSKGEFSVERATSSETLQRGMQVLEALHADRWNAERPGGAFASPRFRGFHREVMPRLLEQGALDLSWLEVRGEPVAALYSMVWDGKVHFYQSGRKPDVPQSIRPGIVLHVHAIQRAIAAGLREYDFLGGASQYKTRMSTATRPLVQLRATRAAVLDTVRGVAKTGMSNVRAWLHRQQSAASS